MTRTVHANDEQQSSTSQEPPIKEKVWFSTHSMTELGQMQSNDPFIGFIYTAKVALQKPSSEDMIDKSPETRHYWIIWDQLQVIDRVLYRRFSTTNQMASNLQLLVPRELRQEVMQLSHDSITSGHLGVKRTKAQLSTRFYWYNMKADIRMHIHCCLECQADKTPNKTPKAPMGHVTAGAPWDILAIDCTGPFPVTKRGNRYIMVVTDHFSKYAEAIPVPDQTAEECATRLLNDVIAHWGTPLSVHTDQGGAFESKLFKELCSLMQIRKTRTSARNPRANGQAERFNRTLLQMVRAYLSGEQDEWDMNLGCLAGAYRSTPHEATKFSPNMLVLGREIRMPADVIYGQPKEEPLDKYSFVQDLQEKMLKAHDVARRHMKASAKRSKEVYDAKMSFHQYNQGDVVWCLQETRKVGVSPKLVRTYDGPFVIKEKRSPINFVLQLNPDNQERVVHHNKLKEFTGRVFPRWITRARQRILVQ